MKILIKDGRVVDPEQKIDGVADVLITDGKISSVSKAQPKPEGARVINAKGKLVIPGAIDVHVHLREPGHEEEETIHTGTRAAAAGGITSLLCMPNTHPVIDNQTAVEFILLKARKEGVINVFPVGAVTKGSDGAELAEIGELKKAGVAAISDDGNPIMNALVMRRALEYSRMFSLPVISHCEDKNLSGDGVMNESYVSTLLGLRGIPAESEEVMVARDITIARLTGGRLHVAHVSTRGSVELIRQAKKAGINVTAETCPHYFVLTDEAVKTYDTNTKIKPPLRTSDDVEAIVEGLKDGTIDCIGTDHAPHTEEEKNKEYDLAPFGIIGLETLLPLTFTYLAGKRKMDLAAVVSKITKNPAKIFSLAGRGSLKEGFPADLTIVDLETERTAGAFISKSKNSPFTGWRMSGFAVTTIVSGKVIMDDGRIVSG
jgi:dihydroorotase